MHVVTHLLAGWALAEQTPLERRDKALVAWASVAPDVDGVGLPVDWALRAAGGSSDLYETYHHVAAHGVVAAILVSALCAPFLQRKALGLALVFFSYHLHLLLDLAGSGGGTPGDIWPIRYLYPFSAHELAWSGQWPLTSWQNTSLTLALMAYALWVGVRRGYTAVGLFSQRADRQLVAALRARFRSSA